MSVSAGKVITFLSIVAVAVLSSFFLTAPDRPPGGGDTVDGAPGLDPQGRAGEAAETGTESAPDPAPTDAATNGETNADAEPDATDAEPSDDEEAALAPYDGWVNPASSGRPWSTEVDGLLTFRGNPTRSFHGRGPVPVGPTRQWEYPAGSSMCGLSDPGGGPIEWCGTGWTGQPAVFERDGRTWAVFGAYDYGVHFVDADTGAAILPPFYTGDIIKGSVTIDPDGYPIVYTGSRDNFFRAIAFDRATPTELWALSADAAPAEFRQWNNDWDGSALVIDDYLFQGGENSVFHIVKLNRGYDAQGLVTVNPELVFTAPGWDQQQLADLGDNNVSIENSVAISGNTVYFGNSGGLIQGWDISLLAAGGTPERVFRWWAGEDTDASVVVDDEGFLYVAAEYEKGRARAQEVGQLVKLDPRVPDDPVVWSFFDAVGGGGLWATPAVLDDVVIASTNTGRLVGLDRATGQILWEKKFVNPLWSSQVVVDDVLIQGDCDGFLHAYDLANPRIDPPELWSVELGGCIESTPAVWDGRIIVGTRAGRVHMVADG